VSVGKGVSVGAGVWVGRGVSVGKGVSVGAGVWVGRGVSEGWTAGALAAAEVTTTVMTVAGSSAGAQPASPTKAPAANRTGIATRA
jgi:tetrahydrodipicolinate N-succinyltransferase